MLFCDEALDMIQDWRAMPSFLIFDCSVVRFMPRRAAAPDGPPITPTGSRGTGRECSRSATSKGAPPLGGAVAGAFNFPKGTIRAWPWGRKTGASIRFLGRGVL